MRELTMNDIKSVTGGSVPSETGGAQYLLGSDDFGDGPGAQEYSFFDARNPLNPGNAQWNLGNVQWNLGNALNDFFDSIFGGE